MVVILWMQCWTSKFHKSRENLDQLSNYKLFQLNSTLQLVNIYLLLLAYVLCRWLIHCVLYVSILSLIENMVNYFLICTLGTQCIKVHSCAAWENLISVYWIIFIPLYTFTVTQAVNLMHKKKDTMCYKQKTNQPTNSLEKSPS